MNKQRTVITVIVLVILVVAVGGFIYKQRHAQNMDDQLGLKARAEVEQAENQTSSSSPVSKVNPKILEVLGQHKIGVGSIDLGEAPIYHVTLEADPQSGPNTDTYNKLYAELFEANGRKLTQLFSDTDKLLIILSPDTTTGSFKVEYVPQDKK